MQPEVDVSNWFAFFKELVFIMSLDVQHLGRTPFIFVNIVICVTNFMTQAAEQSQGITVQILTVCFQVKIPAIDENPAVLIKEFRIG